MTPFVFAVLFHAMLKSAAITPSSRRICLGHEVSHQTVANILKRHGLEPAGTGKEEDVAGIHPVAHRSPGRGGFLHNRSLDRSYQICRLLSWGIISCTPARLTDTYYTMSLLDNNVAFRQFIQIANELCLAEDQVVPRSEYEDHSDLCQTQNSLIGRLKLGKQFSRVF